MYTGLELILIGYILGFIIHIGLFRFFNGFYNYIDNFNILSPTSWCFIWPLSWLAVGIWYVSKLPVLLYYTVDYIVTGQWNYR